MINVNAYALSLSSLLKYLLSLIIMCYAEIIPVLSSKVVISIKHFESKEEEKPLLLWPWTSPERNSKIK